ncbi:MAG: GGDEF domain-containing protein, partial [Janthinobacterium lividum]
TRRYISCCLLVNLFCLLCDRQAGARAFHLGLIFRVAVFTPLVVACLFFLRRPFGALLQCLSATVPLLFNTVFVTLLARVTPQPFADRYLLGAAVGIMAQTLLVPIPFLFSTAALVGATGLLAMVSLMHLGRGFFPPVTPDLVFFVSGVGVCFLYQRYKLEQSTRKDYLLSESKHLHMQEVLSANAHLERLSSLDSLTGVFNRRYLDAALIRLWNVAKENERWIAVLIVDIDHFKRVNDTHGHQHGDFCLEHVAQVLQVSIRAGVDTVARYGGEEFVALLPDADGNLAEEIASRIRQQVEGLCLSSSAKCVVTVSIGIAALRGGQSELTLPDFIATADSALYQAKRSGRNRVINGSHLVEGKTAFALSAV